MKEPLEVCVSCNGTGEKGTYTLIDYHKSEYSEPEFEKCDACNGFGIVKRIVSFHPLTNEEFNRLRPQKEI